MGTPLGLNLFRAGLFLGLRIDPFGLTQGSLVPQLLAAGTLRAMKAQLYQRVGEPSSVQTVGNEAYIFWQCSDGTITVGPTPLDQLNINGFMQGSVSSR